MGDNDNVKGWNNRWYRKWKEYSNKYVKGFPIIDADIVAREVFIIYPEILAKLKMNLVMSFLTER